MKIELESRYIRAAMLCSEPAKSFRYYLAGVSIESDSNSRAVICATNGHILFAAKSAIENYSIPNLIVPIDTLKRALTGHKSETVELEIGERTAINGLQFAPIDGTFPDWRRVIPENGINSEKCAGDKPAHYDPEYVSTMGKIAKALGHKTLAAKIHQNDTSPALVTFDAESACIGVLMPCRNDSTVVDARIIASNICSNGVEKRAAA